MVSPGSAVTRSAVLTIVSSGRSNWTVVTHSGSSLPTGQLLPVVVEVTKLVIVLPPVAGLFTVMEAVAVIDSPIASGPDHVTEPSALNVRPPELATASLL